MAMGATNGGDLTRSLGLRHVFVISTGAMLSSGLFLLPGLAAAEAGPSAVLAYAIAGLLAVPAMLAVAELSTAMPRAGGAYYFLERALGPAVGTVAGMATWLSLVLKDAFALVGMSAYLNIVFDVPAKPPRCGPDRCFHHRQHSGLAGKWCLTDGACGVRPHSSGVVPWRRADPARRRR